MTRVFMARATASFVIGLVIALVGSTSATASPSAGRIRVVSASSASGSTGSSGSPGSTSSPGASATGSRPVRQVLLVGDSFAAKLFPALLWLAPANVHVTCICFPGLNVVAPDDALLRLTSQAVAKLDPDVVIVVQVGAYNDAKPYRYYPNAKPSCLPSKRGKAATLKRGTPAFTTVWKDNHACLLSLARARGARVIQTLIPLSPAKGGALRTHEESILDIERSLIVDGRAEALDWAPLVNDDRSWYDNTGHFTDAANAALATQTWSALIPAVPAIPPVDPSTIAF